MSQNIALIGGLAGHRLLITFIDPFNSHSPQIVDALLNEDAAVGVISSLAYSASGTFLATATLSKTELLVTVWDLATHSMACAFPAVPLTSKFASLCWMGSTVFAATAAGKVYKFDCQQGCLGSECDLNRPNEELISLFALPIRDCWLAVFRSGLVLSMDEKGTQLFVRPAFEDGTQVAATAITESGLLFLALQKGAIAVLDVRLGCEYQVEVTVPLGTNALVQHITVHPAAKSVALVLKDKSIRVLDCSVDREMQGVQLRPRHKFQDAVNRWSWSVCGFSHDGELVWGTSSAPDHHLVYLWDAKTGAIVKMLEGPREDLLVALWNPKRPSIITGSVFGTLFRWIPDYPVRWSALVPGLEEIEENVEYIEREDEFDFVWSVSPHCLISYLDR